MTYPFQNYQQPFQYQDQLNQLRSAPMQMPYQPGYGRQDTSAINWVQGESGAKAWLVTPGSTVLLMDSEGHRFYLKSADPSGMPALRVFEYSEVSADKPQQTAQAPQFVTTDEFAEFKNEVMNKITSLTPSKKKGDANE